MPHNSVTPSRAKVSHAAAPPSPTKLLVRLAFRIGIPMRKALSNAVNASDELPYFVLRQYTAVH
jgi:hypothetical protein